MKTRRSFLNLCGLVLMAPFVAAKALGSTRKPNPETDNWIGHPGEEFIMIDGKKWRIFEMEYKVDEWGSVENKI